VHLYGMLFREEGPSFTCLDCAWSSPTCSIGQMYTRSGSPNSLLSHAQHLPRQVCFTRQNISDRGLSWRPLTGVETTALSCNVIS
jgi:hypothetical protein